MTRQLVLLKVKLKKLELDAKEIKDLKIRRKFFQEVMKARSFAHFA